VPIMGAKVDKKNWLKKKVLYALSLACLMY
jgi:hypothetical protein